MNRILKHVPAVCAAALFSSAAMSAPGTLVASGDEWQLSNYAYSAPYKAATMSFVADMAATFGGTQYLVLTGNPNVTSIHLTEFVNQLQTLGKTVTVSSAIPANFATFDALFHFGQGFNTTSLNAYLQAGGNAFVSLGAGFGGSAAGEANFWNPFLSQYGLTAGSAYFAPAPLTPVSGAGLATVSFSIAAVDSGVLAGNNMIWGNGQTISVVPGSSAAGYATGSFGSFGGGASYGLIGSNRQLMSAVPEPATWASLVLGLGLIGWSVSQRQRARR